MVLRPNLQCLVTTTSPQKIYISVISVPLGVIVLFVALVVDLVIVRGVGVGVFVVVVISGGGNDRTRATMRGEVLVFDEVQIVVDENLVLEVFVVDGNKEAVLFVIVSGGGVGGVEFHVVVIRG